jgi:hypothetical protein
MKNYLNLEQTIDEKVNDEKAKEPEVIDIKKVSEQGEPKKVINKIGVTAGGYATAATLGGMYLLSKGIKKLWEIAYPPKIKKYIAAATTVAFLYGATHPVSTVKFIGEAKRDAIHWVEGVLSDKKDGDKAKEDATTLKKELDAKDKVVKDITSRLEENIGLKFEYKGKYEAATKKLNQAQSQTSIVNKIDEGKETSLRHYISPSVKGEERTFLITKPGTTLVDIARDYIGDSSKWKELADYNGKTVVKRNGQFHVELLIGDKMQIPSKYDVNPNMEFISNDQAPKYSFVKKRGESLEATIEKYKIGIENIDAIREYNNRLMPNISERVQERFWIPEELGKKIFPAFPDREIKEYPSRYNKIN